MNNKKQVFLSLETARKMYNSKCIDLGSNFKNDCLLAFLLDNFTKEGLEAKELPKSWKELKRIEGYFSDGAGHTIKHKYPDSVIFENRDVFPTKELAEASLALAQLLQLRDVYNGNWKADLNNKPSESRYVIYNLYNQICTTHFIGGTNCVLSFKSQEIQQEFRKNFEDLITTALPLL